MYILDRNQRVRNRQRLVGSLPSLMRHLVKSFYYIKYLAEIKAKKKDNFPTVSNTRRYLYFFLFFFRYMCITLKEDSDGGPRMSECDYNVPFFIYITNHFFVIGVISKM